VHHQAKQLRGAAKNQAVRLAELWAAVQWNLFTRDGRPVLRRRVVLSSLCLLVGFLAFTVRYRTVDCVPWASVFLWSAYYVAPRSVAKYCDECLCMFVCLSVCLSARVSRKPHSQFDACCMWPWFGPSLAALYFRFCGNMTSSTKPEVDNVYRNAVMLKRVARLSAR